MTKISVVIPCHNDGPYLEEALASVAAQAHADREVIVVDDRSDDPATLAVFEVLRERGIRIVPSRGPGPAAARNTGIAAATGVYILPLDADDLIEPEYMATAASVLDTESDVCVCFCDVRMFGLRKGEWRFSRQDVASILLGDTIITSASMFRKRDWEAVGGFDETLLHGFEDFSFWLSLLERGHRAHHIPEAFLHYRIKRRSRSARLFIEGREQDAALAVFNAHRDLYARHVEAFFMAYRRLHEERAQRECLLAWRVAGPLLRLEWKARQIVKRLLGRA
ncbi:glycosyltransferase family 2 protein [Desulfovibrio oxamicus]|uniref:Glycosyltransferase family 2 protein n=1 Tax=Nitratidesulfovibrio oxamicus TaxID=32016 RepID=A0ABS0J906_9BACT|nr:glycosyltransferase family A protein [Nitratidesulfovibrio oxamicus]MBG3878622.1 glycosyltransferase family 2 protein [Nitratidesulfovibrio oxamicus]